MGCQFLIPTRKPNPVESEIETGNVNQVKWPRPRGVGGKATSWTRLSNLVHLLSKASASEGGGGKEDAVMSRTVYLGRVALAPVSFSFMNRCSRSWSEMLLLLLLLLLWADDMGDALW